MKSRRSKRSRRVAPTEPASIVMVFIDGCPACVRDKPIFEKLRQGKCKAVSLSMYNGEKDDAFTRSLPDFEFVPSYYLFKKGNPIRRLNGIADVKEKIKSLNAKGGC